MCIRDSDYIVPEVEAIETHVLIEAEKNGKNVIPSAKAVNLTMNRDRIRDRAKILGLPTAKFAYAETEEQLISEAKKIGTKVAVKPVMSSSGKGQSYATTEDELKSSWKFAIEGMRGNRKRVIVEEFIDFDYEITLLTILEKSGNQDTQNTTPNINPVKECSESGVNESLTPTPEVTPVAEVTPTPEVTPVPEVQGIPGSNEVSEVLEDKYAFYLIKAEDKKLGSVKPLTDKTIKEETNNLALLDLRRSAYDRWMTKLKKTASIRRFDSEGKLITKSTD